MTDAGSSPEQEQSSDRGEDDHGSRRSEGTRNPWRWRPAVWLGTLSTVVAIATGMFTLRDQLFPSDSGTAAASVAVYQQSVGDICSALNQADQARVANARSLTTRLSQAKTVLDERNAVLDSWNQVLNGSQYELAQFEGLNVPSVLQARERGTAAAWNRIVLRLRAFTQDLDASSDWPSLASAVKSLPAMQTASEADVVTRTAGLKNLGGGLCMLNQPVSLPAITLPRLSAITVQPRPSQAAAGAGEPSQISPQTSGGSRQVGQSVAPPSHTAGGGRSSQVGASLTPQPAGPPSPSVAPGGSGGSSGSGGSVTPGGGGGTSAGA